MLTSKTYPGNPYSILKTGLYIIPVTLGEEVDPSTTLPASVFKVIGNLTVFVVENIRTARRFLRKAGFDKPFEGVIFYEIDKHSASQDFATLIQMLKEGKPVGLLSEAGAPCVADPGADIVKICHENNIAVFPLTGPSSVLLALMGSGFNGQNFAFHGYLPIENVALRKKLKEMEMAIYQHDQTQIFIETPYRNQKLLETILTTCAGNTALCLATELTTENEMIKTRTLANWRKMSANFNKRPTVFLIYK